MTADELIHRAIGGERRALARAVTWIECRHGGIGKALSQVVVRRRTRVGEPHVVGITGPPGAGKSTFVDGLIARARAEDLRVAVVAVDPSSPFSGGAILGDRVRMERHTGDDGVYIRSLSSRGHLGGLSGAVAEVVDLFDAAGFDLVLVETVGVGQSELGIMEVADTVVVVLTPESGDAVQAMKAGLLEIADVFVVNKADRPGADRMARELARAVALDDGPWRPEVHTAIATEGQGVDAVVEATKAHIAWCKGEGEHRWQERRGAAKERLYLDLVAERARQAALEGLDDATREGLHSGRLDPHELAGDHG
jgi:LAO/AO transport system kinase